MSMNAGTSFEVFLVEDVILTLGNLRNSLAWLAAAEGTSPEERRSGIDRLNRQLDLVEARARELCGNMRRESFACDNLFGFLNGSDNDRFGEHRVNEGRVPIGQVFRDALGEEETLDAAFSFRSIRQSGAA
ncbi:MAG: hypothetical protein KDE03_03445 [Rhodobacteraceae bacterium]|nr:hypothetical protein [Paracoccaceae bacterium]